jgi:hypothetical protein
MPKPVPKLNPDWILQTRDYFLDFLKVTKFPHPVRNGSRGSEFDYPEWLIIFIAILSVKCKARNYLAIHRMTTQYWKDIIQGTKLEKKKVKPISETTLRDRLKKICHEPRKPAAIIFQIFPAPYLK